MPPAPREDAKRPRDDAAAAADDAKRPRADDAPPPTPLRQTPPHLPDAAQDAAPDAQDAATRQNLEARYVGLTFIDDDAAGEGAREIVRIEKAGDAWTAVAARLDAKDDEQPYLVNEALDAMVDAYRCRGRRPPRHVRVPAAARPHHRGPLGGPRPGDGRVAGRLVARGCRRGG